jgi:hypothetical protein
MKKCIDVYRVKGMKYEPKDPVGVDEGDELWITLHDESKPASPIVKSPYPLEVERGGLLTSVEAFVRW